MPENITTEVDQTNSQAYNNNLFAFLADSPTSFHASETMVKELVANGFIRLDESESWLLTQGQGYIVQRDGALLAFVLGSNEQPHDGFRLLAAHTDSPMLMLKPRPQILASGHAQLGIEIYGGPLYSTWFDRDLSLAGRVCCDTQDNGLQVLLVDFKRPLLFIPSIAIHFNREANTKNEINAQKHLVPIIASQLGDTDFAFNELLLSQLRLEHPQTEINEILSFDLFCYDCQPATLTGAGYEFLSGPRLDNLLSCHAGLKAIITADRSKNSLLFCSDHEENGSTSASGANSSFLESVFARISSDAESKWRCLRSSYLMSMDNAHSVHPNYSEKSDGAHPVRLNCGPVIKVNANQRYTSTSVSSAIFKKICKAAEVVPQEFVMRSDMPCGSTIGPITSARLSLRGIDIGAPTLAMHSIREHTGAHDPWLLYKTALQFLQSSFHKEIK